MTTTPKHPANGWAAPGKITQAWHYYRDSESLCGKWLDVGPKIAAKERAPDDCRVCWGKLETTEPPAAPRGPRPPPPLCPNCTAGPLYLCRRCGQPEYFCHECGRVYCPACDGTHAPPTPPRRNT